MGQYWIPVNLDKREFIDPHKLACGLKMWEQLANHPGTSVALVLLLAASPEPRGGGDIGDVDTKNRVVGRWAGDRVALVGDYTERDDLPAKDNADLIFDMCCDDPKELKNLIEYKKGRGDKGFVRLARIFKTKGLYRDISDLVKPVIERELDGKYDNSEGWQKFIRNG